MTDRNASEATSRLLSHVETLTAPSPTSIAAARASLRALGCGELSLLDAHLLTSWGAAHVASLAAAAEEVSIPHAATTEGGLGGGARYLRLDPGHPGSQPGEVETMSSALLTAGVPAIGARLSELLRTFLGALLAMNVRYDRAYMLMMREDDYLSPHDDMQTGNRVNVQFPIPLRCLSSLRVLDSDRFLTAFYDQPGVLRVLGPRVWHEVPALHPLSSDPVRMNLTLRFQFGDAAEA